uniref:Uncharacterized protein n=1 Tax=Bionectria ochroleuca TaxID=29856 RepID=A0A0B7KHE5_BIOOC
MACTAIISHIPNRAMEKLKQAATLTEVAWRAARCSLKRRYNTSQNMVRKRRRQHRKRRPVSRASSTASTPGECADPKANLFFTQLPWEIRRMIQVIAFGERTVHMDLSYRYPLILRDGHSRPTYGAHDDMTGLIWPYEDREELSSRLLHRFLPTVDALICRIVPPSTEVTLSLSPWERYAAVDYQLVAIQGKERSRPRWSEFGGVKCWREIPTKEGATPRGYWVHGYTVGNGPFPDQNHGPFRNEVYKTGKLPPQTYERHRELSQDLWRSWEVDASET